MELPKTSYKETYACHKYDDSNHEKFLKGKRKIYIDFTF